MFGCIENYYNQKMPCSHVHDKKVRKQNESRDYNVLLNRNGPNYFITTYFFTFNIRK